MRAADIVRRIWGDTPLANSANATPATLAVLSAEPLANAANSANAGRYSQDSQHSQPPMNGNAVQPFAGFATFAGGGAGQLLPAHPGRTAFALRNHADAIGHFRRAAAEAERLASLYRSKAEAHTAAAQRLLPPDGFAAWLAELNTERGSHE